MRKRDNSKKSRDSATQQERLLALHSMQSTLVQDHQIACGYLNYIATQPEMAEHDPASQSSMIQAGLEKYATIAQKLLSILEKLTEHEQRITELMRDESADEADDSAPTDLQWDLLLRHAQRTLKQPVLARVPLAKRKPDEDISNS